VGNTVFPLLALNPSARLYACDFAATAVTLVRRHPLYATGRVHAFEADLTDTALTAEVPAGSVDSCTMVFVLSAIAPAKMPQVGRWVDAAPGSQPAAPFLGHTPAAAAPAPAAPAAASGVLPHSCAARATAARATRAPQSIRNVASTLRAGGRVLFRDYAEGDLAQARLEGISSGGEMAAFSLGGAGWRRSSSSSSSGGLGLGACCRRAGASPSRGGWLPVLPPAPLPSPTHPPACTPACLTA
jgi:hypothetical protein